MSLTKNFTDLSTPGPSGPITAWHWDFGDGNTSTLENPSHTYAGPGTYDVTLTVTGSGNDGTASITIPVVATDPAVLTADFVADIAGLTVAFTDRSTPGPSGPITSRHWDFGDGNTSTVTNPSHTYAAAGSYAVTLTVTGTSPDGTATKTRTVTTVSSGGGGFGPWAWDAAHATLDPDSTSKISAFLGYCGPLTYFVAEVATGVVTAHDASAYSVSSAGKHGSAGNLDDPIWFPKGMQPGLSNDHHMSVTDEATGRWTDLELYGTGGVPTSDFAGGQVLNWTGAVSEDIDAVQAPGFGGGNSADAAAFPLQQGVITAAEVAAGVIAHALVFSCNKPGPAPAGGNPFPAASKVGWNNPGHLPAGTWLRLDPAFALPSTLTRFERMICVALQTYGMFLRDQGPVLAIHGTDVGGGGQGNADYAAQGIHLNTAGGNDLKLTGLGLSVMSHLQVLLPPTP